MPDPLIDVRERGGAATGNGGRKRMFTKDLLLMMYGFGDAPSPSLDSANLLDDMVSEYVVSLSLEMARCMERNSSRSSAPGPVELRLALRNDPKKLARAEELLRLQEEINRTRKLYSTDEVTLKAATSGPSTGAAPGDG
ncbi:transcription initiation factor IID, 18kD subunit-domain-containing protein [Piptocephalis cylindrospora]|uniref:Transcription initiation factor TFIID subunit 13 n=1 Tax=Piptocephalis cylindrospora TaxID=1907219 RepID=A0A4P9Y6Y8_9FUNG|nr:transcription initiation factor IID, 18kD subunit-domain-containing protein [Piptocephalis cylindrospora]|eukprot:RKP14857.1 transcription initiation factor IID, 18kD subunit-domain-containing protein [Piptocephalis cylindrospora]